MGNLMAKTGLSFDLPTEAEWEYACRAGTITEWSYGSVGDGAYEWDSSNASSATHEVGGKLPNPWGFYDIHGNVWEWCLDWHSATYSPAGDQTDPEGTTSGSGRVIRGGAFSDAASSSRSALRSNLAPTIRNNFFGLRLFFRPQ
jgi:formylglycine-generating enzyme required for sulfatase activity